MNKVQETAVKNINSERNGAFYLFDIGELFSWYDKIDSYLKNELNGNGELVYAIKANPFLTKYMDKKVNSFEVCSPGEFEICMKQKIASEKIVFSGVYKSKENIIRVFEEDFKGIFTLESPNHYKLLKEVISERNIDKVTVLPRLSSGNQFGMDEETLMEVLKDALSNEHIQVAGIQYFSGTQKKKIKVIEEELEKIDLFCEKISRETGFKVEFVEYGPGFYFDYYGNGDQMQVFEEVVGAIKRYSGKYRFALESGRFLAASCGKYVTKIVDIKETYDKKYCLVDGGIHHVNYYGRMLGMNVPSVCHMKTSTGECINASATGDKYDVAGALCTVSDVLLKNYTLNNPKEGDLLVFEDAGAYSVTEASALFLSRDLPRVYALDESGEVSLLRDTILSYDFNS